MYKQCSLYVLVLQFSQLLCQTFINTALLAWLLLCLTHSTLLTPCEYQPIHLCCSSSPARITLSLSFLYSSVSVGPLHPLLSLEPSHWKTQSLIDIPKKLKSSMQGPAWPWQQQALPEDVDLSVFDILNVFYHCWFLSQSHLLPNTISAQKAEDVALGTLDLANLSIMHASDSTTHTRGGTRPQASTPFYSIQLVFQFCYGPCGPRGYLTWVRAVGSRWSLSSMVLGEEALTAKYRQSKRRNQRSLVIVQGKDKDKTEV